MLGLRNETFADGTLDLQNFGLVNGPDGLTAASVHYIDIDSAGIVLAFDSTDFDTDISNFYVLVDGQELSRGNSIASNALAIDATDDEESIQITDDGNITEGMEDGEVITVSLQGGTFADTLQTGNWTFGTMPQGVSVGSIDRPDKTEVLLTLNGNRTADYDEDMEDFSVTVGAAEINDHTGADISAGTGVVFRALREYAEINTGGIALDEQNLDGAVIQLGLFHETFSGSETDPAHFILNNVPPGLSLDSVRHIRNDSATLHLAFDHTDFDADYPFFNLRILPDALNGYGEVNSDSLSIAAVDEPAGVSISHEGLTADNLDGAGIIVELTQVQFSDTILSRDDFVLNNAPAGTETDTVTWSDSTHAMLIIEYDGTPFSQGITDFSITVLSPALTRAVDLTSNSLSINVTGIRQNGHEEFVRIYSSGNRLFIKTEAPEKLIEMELYNLLGKKIFIRKMEKVPLNVIHMTDPSGLYLVRLKMTGKIITSKVYIHQD